MTRAPIHAVFDCNVYLQAMISPYGAAHQCWQRALAGEIRLYVTAYILDEVTGLAQHRKLFRLRQFTHERLDRFVHILTRTASFVDSPPHLFTYPRDPKDSPYVDLAIFTGAFLVASNDKDLLDLMNDGDKAGVELRRQYPSFRVLTPAQLLVALDV
ncbi:MAG TPA: putative toxin-antitoxin system toxin component, PIN family [Tepidisphaeraceae bacterium]|jgi:putative PIN family toxin of toxin-antitoxin system|nr:putative toxin-antitoxin system toxin component, PIN family [Tepidisphaeraceae bacterium]